MFLALKDLKYNKSRYLLITSILILLVFLVLFLAGLANGLSSATGSAISTSDATHYIISNDSDNLITRSSITTSQLGEVKNKVKDVTPINLQRTAIKKNNNDKKIDITYLALDPSDFLIPEIIKGRSIGTNTENYEIVLNNSFIDDGFKIGDIITDSSSGLELTVVGFTKNQMYAHSPIGVISISTHNRIKELTTNNSEIRYNALALKGNVNVSIDETSIVSKADIINNIPGHTQEQSTILMILTVLLVISSFILGVFFYVITIQKLPQFGVLKSLGTSMKTLSSMILCQVFILSSISMVIGNLLTFSLANILPNSMPFTLTYKSAAIVSTIFIIISMISSLFSLIKITKVDPLSVIGGNE